MATSSSRSHCPRWARNLVRQINEALSKGLGVILEITFRRRGKKKRLRTRERLIQAAPQSAWEALKRVVDECGGTHWVRIVRTVPVAA